ncbi:MAG: glycosyltransferase family 4 protein [Thermodesulfovibrionales bacterium]
MKIILINKFLYPKGGDAISTLETGRLLSDKGHEVYYWGMEHPENPDYPYKAYFVSYVDYNKPSGVFKELKSALNILYSFEAKRKIDTFIKMIKPDIVHLNNFAHQISPSILYVFTKYKIPTVMTMRDYKLVCPSYSMLLKGRPCERCKNGRYYFCFLKRCTKGSFVKSLLNTIEMYLHHDILHIYNKIDIFISPSRFLMEKVKEMGFKGKIIYLPNFVDVKNLQPSYNYEEESIVYFGRLSYEKGLETLIEAVKGLPIRLKIIGEGPLKGYLISKVKNERINNIDFLGYKKGNELEKEIKKSMFVVLPSEWYENNPRTVIESFALGKPVIGARIGGIPELVIDNETGLTFRPQSIEDLREKLLRLVNDKSGIVEMGRKARKYIEERFNPERHYEELMTIYKKAIERRL